MNLIASTGVAPWITSVSIFLSLFTAIGLATYRAWKRNMEGSTRRIIVTAQPDRWTWIDSDEVVQVID